MLIGRWTAFALAAVLAGVNSADGAELPSQNKKPRPPEAVKHCDIAGSPGVLAANGICVRMSGYVSTRVGAGQLK